MTGVIVGVIVLQQRTPAVVSFINVLAFLLCNGKTLCF